VTLLRGVRILVLSILLAAQAAGAVEVGARYLWLQLGVFHRDAIDHAETHGLTCIVDRCMKIEHARFRP